MKFSMLRVALAALVTTGALAASAGTASAALLTSDAVCGDPVSAQVFQPWLDPASYFLAPAGDFEHGTDGWTLTGGARVVADQEPWNVTGTAGDSALELPAGATAVSPAVCAGLLEPTVRMFARGTGTLTVSARVKLLLGPTLTVPIGVSTGTAWKPTLAFAMVVNVLGVDRKVPVQIVLASAKGSSRVDDVYIDPWRAR